MAKLPGVGGLGVFVKNSWIPVVVSRVTFEGATVWPAARAATRAADKRRKSDNAAMVGLRGSRKSDEKGIEKRESGEEDPSRTLYSHIHQ